MNGLYKWRVSCTLSCDCLWLALWLVAISELGRKGEMVWGRAFPDENPKLGVWYAAHRGHLCPGNPKSRLVPRFCGIKVTRTVFRSWDPPIHLSLRLRVEL